MAGPVGVVIAKSHIFGPNPLTYFCLGVLATLTVGGTVYGVHEGRRIARTKSFISN